MPTRRTSRISSSTLRVSTIKANAPQPNTATAKPESRPITMNATVPQALVAGSRSGTQPGPNAPPITTITTAASAFNAPIASARSRFTCVSHLGCNAANCAGTTQASASPTFLATGVRNAGAGPDAFNQPKRLPWTLVDFGYPPTRQHHDAHAVDRAAAPTDMWLAPTTPTS